MASDTSPNRTGTPADLRAGEILSRGTSQLRRDPWLFAPFLVAGVVLSLIDWLRRVDPLPVLVSAPTVTDGVDITLEYMGYPTGVTGTERAFESLIGLEVPYLLWGVGLEVLALFVLSIAAGLTIGRAMDGSVSWVALARLSGYVIGLNLGFRVIGSFDAMQSMGVIGLVPMVMVLYLFVRLFAIPGYIVAGQPIGAAIRESFHRTFGHGWTVFGLVLVVGFGTWLLAFVPYGATLLTSTVIAPIHAVAIAAFLDLRDP